MHDYQRRRRRLGFLPALLCASWSVCADPPRVVSIAPVIGNVDVDPTITEIRVEFDQPMTVGSHSWTGGGPTFPQLRGQPTWPSDRITVLPVTLVPNHFYRFGLNGGRFQGFKNAAGEVLPPVDVEFITADPDAPPPTRAENLRAFGELKTAIDTRYSHRDLRVKDWARVYATYEDRFANAATVHQFGRLAGELLAPAEDAHITVTHSDLFYPGFRRVVTPNVRLERLPLLVEGFQRRTNAVATGRIQGGGGYVMIATWGRENEADLAVLDDVLREFADAPFLIVDVRVNSGGDERLAKRFAACFVEKPAVYARHVNRDASLPGGVTQPIDRTIGPRADGPSWRKPVAVLMGPANMSSAEAFLLMMRQDADATLIGVNSYGSSGNPKPVELSNGVHVLLPSWRALDAAGRPFEGVGIEPDIVVESDPAHAGDVDPVLRRAIEVLTGDD